MTTNTRLKRIRAFGRGVTVRMARLDRLAVLGALALAGAAGCFAVAARDVSPTTPLPHAPTATLTQVLDAVGRRQVRSARLDEGANLLSVTFAPAAGSSRRTQAPAAEVVLPQAYLHDVISAVVKADVPLTVIDPATPSKSTSTSTTDTAGTTTTSALALPHADGPASALVPQPATSVPAPTPTVQRTQSDPGFGRAMGWGVVLTLLGAGLLISAAARRQRRMEASSAAAPGPATASGGPRTARVGAGRGGAAAFEPAVVPTTRFSDVAGCEEAIEDLRELAAFLTEPERFTRLGATVPKGALLAGPPGTGKTLLARAVAGEAGVPFFSVAGSDFVEKYVGVGARRVRDLFAQARKHPKAIIFIDEVDAVARRRSGADNGANTETEATLIALLAEMDGFDASSVVVLAATNRADILDAAITRPGRLDRKVEVPNPDRRGREQILRVHVRNKPMAADVDLHAVSARTPGFSGAELAALVNEACMTAARRDLDQVTQACLTDAVATIAMGRARTSAVVTEHDRTVTAWHEAGHTIAAYLQQDADDPAEVTIIPRGPAGGLTWIPPTDDQFLGRRKAHAQLVTALAGRAGEELLLGGEFTQGASGDLRSATDLATRMVTQYGMTRAGYQVRDARAGDSHVQEVVEELLVQAHRTATALLGEHKGFMVALAAALLQEETLTYAQVEEIAAQCGVARHAHTPIPTLPHATDTTAMLEPVVRRRLSRVPGEGLQGVRRATRGLWRRTRGQS